MMKYNVNSLDELIIRNNSDRIIFIISDENKWIKYDFDHQGKPLYYEDYSGNINNYKDEI